MMRCRAWYTDHHGTLEGVMTLGPDSFVLEVGGVRFEGGDASILTPIAHTPWASLERFALNGYQHLDLCTLEWVQSMTLQIGELLEEACDVWIRAAVLHTEPPHITTYAVHTIGFEFEGRMVEASDECYEDVLYKLWSVLPEVRLRCCYTCARHELMPFRGAQQVCAGRCLLGHEVELATARAVVQEGRARQLALYYLIQRAAAPYVSELHVCDAYTRTL